MGRNRYRIQRNIEKSDYVKPEDRKIISQLFAEPSRFSFKALDGHLSGSMETKDAEAQTSERDFAVTARSMLTPAENHYCRAILCYMRKLEPALKYGYGNEKRVRKLILKTVTVISGLCRLVDDFLKAEQAHSIQVNQLKEHEVQDQYQDLD